jgi:hypothetical protein
MRIVRVCLLLAVGLVAACGGSTKAYVPVDSQIKPWQPPELPEEEPAADAAASERETGN